ncbi:MAG: hypothetical protein L0229_06390 [Blastocatellia bacterium]|nr:hypothetical protein [Blastocatellia bacterium]
MKTKTLAVGLALIILLMNSSAAVAMQKTAPSSDWIVVKSLPNGTRLSVRLKDGKKVEGTLSGVSDTTLSLEYKNKTTDLDQSKISKVHRVVPRSIGKSIGKSSLIGAAIGGGAGVSMGVGIGNYEDLERGDLAVIFGLIGAGIGAGIGAMTGAIRGGGNKKELIYESK